LNYGGLLALNRAISGRGFKPKVYLAFSKIL
jgi:hypothetical protein